MNHYHESIFCTVAKYLETQTVLSTICRLIKHAEDYHALGKKKFQNKAQHPI